MTDVGGVRFTYFPFSDSLTEVYGFDDSLNSIFCDNTEDEADLSLLSISDLRQKAVSSFLSICCILADVHASSYVNLKCKKGQMKEYQTMNYYFHYAYLTECSCC